MIAAEARAKVNLALGVVGRRPDGYHDLVSVFVRLDLADRLTVVSTEGDSDDRLVVTGGPIDYRPGPEDLVLRALALLRAARAPAAPGLVVRLEKHVPLAAGLGGGSADAAATLDLAARAWGVNLAPAERRSLAAQLGSDVPFLAADVDAALVTGRGEQVTALPGPRGPAGIVLATVGAGISTRDVFAALAPTMRSSAAAGAGSAPRHAAAADRARDLAARLAAGCTPAALAETAAMLRDANDLWPAAVGLRPDLAEVRDRLEARLGRPVLLSGSGPTLFALYASVAAAEVAATALRADPIAGLDAGAVRAASIGRTTNRERP